MFDTLAATDRLGLGPRQGGLVLVIGLSTGGLVGSPLLVAILLSAKLLADMVGSSRETVTRSLDELRRDGFVADAGA